MIAIPPADDCGSLHVTREVLSRLARFTILLNEGCPQTGNAVAFERALLGKELLPSELITVQGLLHRRATQRLPRLCDRPAIAGIRGR
jgi:hypothetical protein